jgi:hypothetical protein
VGDWDKYTEAEDHFDNVLLSFLSGRAFTIEWDVADFAEERDFAEAGQRVVLGIMI